mgnify:CR=1 FL=1
MTRYTTHAHSTVTVAASAAAPTKSQSTRSPVASIVEPSGTALASFFVLGAEQGLDASVPPIAHHSPDLGSESGLPSPYVPMDRSLAQHERLYYYAATSWVDSRIGLVLGELDRLELAPITLAVLHSDHGWALGEHGQWQKFSNWEVGVRVPLMVRAPWLDKGGDKGDEKGGAAGRVSSALAELVDVYPTIVDLAGVAPPTGETLDGTSLGWALRAATGAEAAAAARAHDGKAAVLSQYARCPLRADADGGGGGAGGDGVWITNATEMWRNNWCEFVDRSAMPWMGYSLRTDGWRLTEWAKWDGDRLRPDWSASVGLELYDHRHVDDNSFDATENVNVAAQNAAQNAALVAQLCAQLHAMVQAGGEAASMVEAS